MELREGLLDDPQVVALIARHRAEALGSTPVDNAHALGAEALRAPDIAFWSMWEGDALLGIAALRLLDASHAEIKSMRTAPAHLRRGVARLLLDHLIAVARTKGCRRVSLETGTAPMFAAANQMYENIWLHRWPAVQRLSAQPPQPLHDANLAISVFQTNSSRRKSAIACQLRRSARSS